MYKYCIRCGRRLKSLEARERGYGKTCEGKAKQALRHPLISPSYSKDKAKDKDSEN